MSLANAWHDCRGVLVCGLLACALLAGGCAQTRRETLGKFRPDRGDSVLTSTPRTGTYKIKFPDASSGEMKTAPYSKRLLRRGTPVGFRAGPGGQVIAIAGDETFPVQGLPPSAEYCVWYYKYKDAPDVPDAVKDAGAVLGSGALVVGGAAVVATAALLGAGHKERERARSSPEAMVEYENLKMLKKRARRRARARHR